MNRELVLLLLLITVSGARAAPVHYTLGPGQTLADVSHRYGTAVAVIRKANPDLDVHQGTTVTVPAPAAGWPTHLVQRGETLWKLSRRYATSVQAIEQANAMDSPDVKAGQTLIIPVDPRTISGWVQVRLKDGALAWVKRRYLLVGSTAPTGRAHILAVARRLEGTPYRWGGQTPNGVDCSGFVEEVFHLAGYDLPRTADAQYRFCQPVADDALEPGDLVFFSTYLPGPSHVGIYAGNDHFIQASSSHGVIESSLKQPYYRQRFLGGRRPPQLAAAQPRT